LLTLELTLEYDRKRTAEAVYGAICPDNDGYVESELLGKSIILKMEAETAGTLKNTVDDLLACVKAAEEAAGLASFPEEEE
jgi:tRNA threonylcarbamoyladenosine modification (KEOPS) complex  Pcc1 subunit